jgi:hypothetical protein
MQTLRVQSFPLVLVAALFGCHGSHEAATGSGGSAGGATTGAGGAGGGTPAVSVTIAPVTATVAASGSQQFTCTVKGSPNGACTWAVKEGAAAGAVSASGLYTAPTALGTYHVVATSQASPSASATATIVVSPPAMGQVGVWTRMLNWPLASMLIGGEGMLLDPVRPSDLYFFYEASKPNASGDRHVLKSTDYGSTWTPIDKTQSHGNAWGVAIDPNPLRDPATPPTMYTPAGYGDLGIWKSTDGGVTWVDLFANASNGVVPAPGGGTSTFPADKNGIHVDFYQVCILPDDPPNHILITYHYGTTGAQALGESTDGGATWEVHNVPFGDSHYVYAIDAKTWVLIAGWGGPGIYRTTTAGRVNGVISESAWTQVSTFTHEHGSFTPWLDTKTNELYFPGGGVFPIQGIQRSGDGGATWTSVFSNAPTGWVVGTQKWLYASEAGGPDVLRALPSDLTQWPAMTPAPGPAWLGGLPPYGVVTTFDGQHSIIVSAAYAQSPMVNGMPTVNGDIWRYIEP